MPDRVEHDGSFRDIILHWVEKQGLASGSRLPTERDLAFVLGTSRATVNRALVDLVADGLVRQESRKVRVWIGNRIQASQGALVIVTAALTCPPPQAGSDVMPGPQELYQGVVDEIRRRGLPLVTVTPQEFFVEGLARVSESRGVLIMPDANFRDHASELFEAIHRVRLPVVIPGDGFTPKELAACRADAVQSDHTAGSEALVRYLHGRGRRRIRMVFHRGIGGEPVDPPPWLITRMAGWRRACLALDLPLLPPVELLQLPVYPATDRLFNDQVLLEMGCLTEVLSGPDRPDALMFSSDGQIFSAASACQRLGCVPGRDIDLVGYDNYADHPFVALLRRRAPAGPQATIDRCMAEVGVAMVQMVCDRAEGRLPPVPQRRLMPVRLVGAAGDAREAP